jgi:putative tryptophan/tyrosine transport system substrate-binding protein
MSLDQLRRRDFITLVSGAAAWPIAARAQQSLLPVIGYLTAKIPDSAYRFDWWLEGLKDAGFAAGQNVRIEYRFQDLPSLEALTADLVRRKVAIIVAEGGPATRAASTGTATIPILFFDLNGEGPPFFEKRPNNITGVTTRLRGLVGRRLALLLNIAPKAARVSLLADRRSVETIQDMRDIAEAARALGRQVAIVETYSGDLEAAFETVARQRADALVVGPGALFEDKSAKLISLAARNNIPTIYPSRRFVLGGGLISYGASWRDAHHQLADYTARILKGANPVDMPITEPAKLEITINQKTAKTLGIDIPPLLLARADEVIE